jgi:hypothetical protein
MSEAQSRARPNFATAIAGLLVVVGVALASVSLSGPDVKPVAGLLTLCALVAELIATAYTTQIMVSAAFVAGALAIGFVGPGAAFFIPAISFVGVWLVEHYRWRALVINVASSATPTCVVAIAFQAVTSARHGAGFVALLALAAAVTMALNSVIAQVLLAMLDGDSIRVRLRALRGLIVPVLVNIAVVAVIAEI